MTLTEFPQQLLSVLRELLAYVFDPNKRLYWGYLVGAVLLAWCCFKQSQQSSFFNFLFPQSIYQHRSIKHDLGMLIINKLIKTFLFAPFVLTMVPIAIAVSDGLSWLLPWQGFVHAPSSIVIFSFTFLLFIVDDFTRFLLHFALHKIPALWLFHQVHHSAPVLTPLTIYRSHPLESFLYACRMAIAQGIAVGLGYYLFGDRLQMFDVLGANVFVFLFNLFGANLRHSHIAFTWPKPLRWLESWVISPLQHQLHHSTAPEHRHKNLGSALAIWDRCFGSWLGTQQHTKSPTQTATQAVKQTLTFGCPAVHHSLLALYLDPFKELYKSLQKPFTHLNKTK